MYFKETFPDEVSLYEDFSVNEKVFIHVNVIIDYLYIMVFEFEFNLLVLSR